jgi:coenzyme PQQ precursor peptide PqqA
MAGPLGAEGQSSDHDGPEPHCSGFRSEAAAAGRHPHMECPMKTWETPKATDIRFGFEITMYVAAR